jgi:hypothetical protein
MTSQLFNHPGDIVRGDDQIGRERPEASGVELPVRTPGFTDPHHGAGIFRIKRTPALSTAPSSYLGEVFT